MKGLIAIFILAFLVIVLAGLSFKPTGMVVEKDPCRLVNCNVRLFYFWQTNAEWLNTTEDGYAVCHCPNQPLEVLYFIKMHREY